MYRLLPRVLAIGRTRTLQPSLELQRKPDQICTTPGTGNRVTCGGAIPCMSAGACASQYSPKPGRCAWSRVRHSPFSRMRTSAPLNLRVMSSGGNTYQPKAEAALTGSQCLNAIIGNVPRADLSARIGGIAAG